VKYFALHLYRELPSRCTVECDLGQVVYTHAPLSPSSIIWYQRKLGSKQAHRATHWPRVHGLAASAGVWLRANESEISAALWAKWLEKEILTSWLYLTGIFTIYHPVWYHTAMLYFHVWLLSNSIQDTDGRTDKETRTRTNNVHHDRHRHAVSTSLRLVDPICKRHVSLSVRPSFRCNLTLIVSVRCKIKLHFNVSVSQ